MGIYSLLITYYSLLQNHRPFFLGEYVKIPTLLRVEGGDSPDMLNPISQPDYVIWNYTEHRPLNANGYATS